MAPRHEQISPWRYRLSRFPETEERPMPTEADVVVIGAGLTGLATARALSEAGKRVVVLDMADVGAGETGNSSAHVTWLWDAGFKMLRSRFGDEQAQLALQAHIEAVRGLAQIAESLPCDAHAVPAYIYASNAAQREELQEELAAIEALGGQGSIEDEVPLPYKTSGALRVGDSLQLDPLALARGLAHQIRGENCIIKNNVRVHTVDDTRDGCRVRTDHGSITCEHVVHATHTPLNRFALHTKQAAYRTYVMAFHGAEDMPPGLFLDMASPYHYIRRHEMPDGKPLLLVGGADHKTGETGERAPFAALEKFARRHFDTATLAYRWSGQVLEPVDGLPFIGLNPGDTRTYVATGFSGTGLSAAMLAAPIISDHILGRENPYADVFSPSRFKPIAQFRQFVRENADVPKHMLLDRLTAHIGVSELNEGDGAVVRDGVTTWAVYRDEARKLHAFSPVCPHLGCYVQFNNVEKTWDCPCHGSRFSAAEGRVLNGPAVDDLREHELSDAAERDVERSAAPRAEEEEDARQ